MTKSHNYKMAAFFLVIFAGLVALWQSPASSDRGGGLPAGRTNDTRRPFTLAVDDYWRLGSAKQERFDASGLLVHDGRLLTINDRGSELYEISFGKDHVAELKQTTFFPFATLAKVSPRRETRYDCEGIAADAEGNLYICEESRRGVYRSSPDAKNVELLPIDWNPAAKFFKGGINASFEGIAIGQGKLYVANERDAPRIISVSLDTLRVEDSFVVDSSGFALGGPHYSDLAFHNGKLFVLDRNHRSILEVDPSSKKVLAEYSFGQFEISEEFGYFTDYPTGAMEGLAIDENYFWLVTDNNGRGRFKARDDFRPTLYRCRRPTREKS
jgi:uncharacterized protein YjiK